MLVMRKMCFQNNMYITELPIQLYINKLTVCSDWGVILSQFYFPCLCFISLGFF